MACTVVSKSLSVTGTVKGYVVKKKKNLFKTKILKVKFKI